MEYNSSLKRLTQLLMVSADSQQHRRMLELSISVCILFILLWISISFYKDNHTKAIKLSTISYLAPVMDDDVVDYALTGRWSDQQQSASDIIKYGGTQGVSVDNIRSIKGNYFITYTIAQDKTYVDGYRLTYKDPLQPTLYWTCGYAKPRVDEVIPMANQTDAPKLLLTHLCR
ncbi:MAG: hypothetical protein HKP09_06060 [Enterobacterales bacterium]|nr:hypothetical protein [Enterobacterales bacterium]